MDNTLKTFIRDTSSQCICNNITCKDWKNRRRNNQNIPKTHGKRRQPG